MCNNFVANCLAINLTIPTCFHKLFKENEEYRATFHGKISTACLVQQWMKETVLAISEIICNFYGSFDSFGLVVETNKP